ncbi:MAG: hypothetical protein J5918_08780 [Prevotella sp.]|nr:hypothetical protein [Prevotella sp.]
MLKYNSNPKPVRIRIESGGEEHFSLDSLLKCFAPNDIVDKKTELIRWLNTQGEESMRIAKRIENIDFSRGNICQIYSIFFPEKNTSTIVELYVDLKKSGDYNKNFNLFKKYCLIDGNTIEQLYSAKETSCLEDWFSIIKKYVEDNYIENNSFKTDIETPELLYDLGCLYFEKQKDKNKAFVYFNEAMKFDSNVEKIENYIKDHDISSPFSDFDFKDIKTYVYYLKNNNYDYLISIRKKMREKRLTQMEDKIFKFINDCETVIQYKKNAPYRHESGETVYEKAKRLLLGKDDELKNLRLYVLSILGNQPEMYRSRKIESQVELEKLREDKIIDKDFMDEVDKYKSFDKKIYHILYNLQSVLGK